jgi:hypothetical protein
VLGVCVVQDCDGVAIGHIDDLAQQGVGMGLECQAQRQHGGRRFEYHLHGGFILRVRYRVVSSIDLLQTFNPPPA